VDDDSRIGAIGARVGQKSLADHGLTVLFWSLLALIIVMHFSQLSPSIFGVKLWTSWSPAFRGYAVAHAAAATGMSLLWYLQKNRTTSRWITTALLLVFVGYWGYYFFTRQLELFYRPNVGSDPDLIIGLIMFVMTLYLTWVHWGPIFPALAFVFVAYLFIADLLPGPLKGPPLATMEILTRIIQRLVFDLMELMSAFLWLLIFWGLLLNAVGAGIAILGLARLLSRTGIAGGPAIGALLASAITGSFVGGGTSNVAVTGPITIPAMRKAGYSREQAAAVEAIASNASGITPPVLGTVAFIMAEIVGVGYIEIIVMSLVPAFLWFLAAGIYIYAHAQRHRDVILRIHEQEVGESESGAWLYARSALLMIIPVGIIVYLVMQGFTLRWGASWAFLLTVILGVCLRVETRWSVWSEGIRRAAFYASSVTVIIIVLSIIADAITYTGLGGRLGGIVEDISGGEMLIAGAIMIFFGVILGAGLPALAIYFIMAITFAPVLSRLGIDHRVSHFVAFYMGNLGTIIPPVAGSALVAAIVANTTYWPVCRAITKMSWPMWVFPLLFLVAPQLLLIETDVVGTATTMLIIAASAFAISGVQVSTAGWLFRNLIMPVRIVLYLNFFLLAMALRNQSEPLMLVVIGVAIGSAVVAYFTGEEPAEAPPAPVKA
jgi:TRAP transporter 4TM/12TM fusion protein